jgi:hypothetical protein
MDGLCEVRSVRVRFFAAVYEAGSRLRTRSQLDGMGAADVRAVRNAELDYFKGF